ncbi:hypothetical protein [Massilia sp. TSP1-1-2]|uniref:hypothetical protein n=1 Tax=Massilia sp. TSP1-1-2 TaxID=2804649 RepID=UPI003CEC7FA3
MTDASTFTNGRMDLMGAAGTAVHEGTHYLQYISPDFKGWHRGHEFEAFREQGLVDWRAVGAPYRKSSHLPTEGNTDLGLSHLINRSPSYRHLANDPLQRGRFNIMTDVKAVWQGLKMSL